MASGLTEGYYVPRTAFPTEAAQHFESESNGFATGTQGHAVYSSDAGDVSLFWDDPFIGSNSFTADAPPPIQAQVAGNLRQQRRRHRRALDNFL